MNNYHIVAAENCDDALMTARSSQFDLYLIDNWMAGCSGVDLCKKLREFDPLTPVLFYSGAAYETDKQQAFTAGAQGYLVKPVGNDELISGLSTHFSSEAHNIDISVEILRDSILKDDFRMKDGVLATSGAERIERHLTLISKKMSKLSNLEFFRMVVANGDAGDEASSLLTRDELKMRERESIIAALNQAAGKVSGSDGAAALLGMKPTTLYSRILALGLRATESASTNSRVA